MASAAVAVQKNTTSVPFTKRNDMRRVRDVSNHNWQDAGHGLCICKDCEAQLEQANGYQIYTAGNGDCDKE